jgi:hypothetical protein
MNNISIAAVCNNANNLMFTMQTSDFYIKVIYSRILRKYCRELLAWSIQGG